MSQESPPAKSQSLPKGEKCHNDTNAALLRFHPILLYQKYPSGMTPSTILFHAITVTRHCFGVAGCHEQLAVWNLVLKLV